MSNSEEGVDLFENAYEEFEVTDFGLDMDFLNTPNVDLGNFATGGVAFDNIIDTEGESLIEMLGQQGAQYDAMISQQESLLPMVNEQIFAIQIQMAQNPELRAVLYPTLLQLREQQNAITELSEARNDMMESISSAYEVQAESYQVATGNIKNAANSVSSLSSIIGDISVGEGIDA